MEHIEELYAQAVREVRDTGTLCLASRRAIRAQLGVAANKHLAVACIQKVLANWNESDGELAPIKPVLAVLEAHVRDEAFDRGTADLLNGFLEHAERVLGETGRFMVGYLYQALRDAVLVFMEVPEGEPAEREEDLDYDEWETARCACMLWVYQAETAGRGARRQREAQFWDWYLREAAREQGIALPQEVPPETAAPTAGPQRITTVEELVKAISHEFSYVSHAYRDGVLTIRVLNRKDGAACTTCHHFSNHAKDDYSGIMKLGRLNGVPIRLHITNFLYYCENPDCPEEAFMTRSEVDYQERTANYKNIVRELGSEKLLELLGVG